MSMLRRDQHCAEGEHRRGAADAPGSRRTAGAGRCQRGCEGMAERRARHTMAAATRNQIATAIHVQTVANARTGASSAARATWNADAAYMPTGNNVANRRES